VKSIDKINDLMLIINICINNINYLINYIDLISDI
jgi:hypothetical protein